MFDSQYDSYQGVIAYVRLFDGRVAAGDKLFLIQNKVDGLAKETGCFAANVKNGFFGMRPDRLYCHRRQGPGESAGGETITQSWAYNEKTKTYSVGALPGYDEPKPMIFASVYPAVPDDFDALKAALAKLKLSDPAFVFEPEMKEFLGRGYRCGFLGTLHAEIVCERLFREFGLDLIIFFAVGDLQNHR